MGQYSQGVISTKKTEHKKTQQSNVKASGNIQTKATIRHRGHYTATKNKRNPHMGPANQQIVH